jgi:predicted HAD superfamily Cof-like phosphohydrolase
MDFKPTWSKYPKLAAMFENRPEINMYWDELRQLLKEARADAVQTIKDLNGEELNAARRAGRREAQSTICQQVEEFHRKFEQPILTTPQIPSEERIRHRLRLVAEEFFEFLAACHVYPSMPANYVMDAVKNDIEKAALKIDMVELADALGDLDYVVEGTRVEFGINGAPIAAEIQRSNMAKVFVPSKNGEGTKPRKPEGWTPPDVAGELKKQGWVP